jgi:flagellar hook-length control protein FliK
MADLAQIVLSLLPTALDVKAAPSTEISTETGVQGDFLSLLSGQLSGLLGESDAQIAAPLKASVRGKGLPQEEDSGNLVPVAASAPPAVLVSAIWAATSEEGQASKVKSELGEESGSSVNIEAGVAVAPTVALVEPATNNLAVDAVPTDVVSQTSLDDEEKLASTPATIPNPLVTPAPIVVEQTKLAPISPDNPARVAPESIAEAIPANVSSIAIQHPVAQPSAPKGQPSDILYASSNDAGNALLHSSSALGLPLTETAKKILTSEPVLEKESDLESFEAAVKQLLPAIDPKRTLPSPKPTDAEKLSTAQLQLPQENKPEPLLFDHAANALSECQSPDMKEAMTIIGERMAPEPNRGGFESPVSALSASMDAPDKPTSASFPSVANAANPPLALNQPGWEQALAQRIVYQVNQSSQSAQISLHPPELGKLDVHVELLRDQANVTFTSTHGAVRESIEAAVPRLREMFADSGMVLVNVNVSSGHSFAQTNQYQNENAASNGEAGVAQRSDGAVESNVRIARGLVDLYA